MGDLLEDADPMVRINALAGVRLMRREENLSKHAAAVQALLRDPVAQVRTAAVGAAARLPGQAARDEVRAVLRSAEEPMRFQAACVLADLRDAAALPELIAALREDIRRQEALSAILTLGDAAALPAVAALFEEEGASEFDRTMAAAALARLGDARGGEHLARRIAEGADDGPVAAEMAGRLGVQEAVPALRAVAEEEGALARGAALRALGRLRAPGAEERLLALAADGSAPDDLRMDAAEGLAELDTPPARELLNVLAAEAGGDLGALCADLLFELSHLEG
jgi:HEAT repeat protein